MLRIADRDLAPKAVSVLDALQAIVDSAPDYPKRVVAAKDQWQEKTSTVAKSNAFRTVRATLADMCVGPIRCSYCEDSLADEIEHIYPKNLFPEVTFRWSNYLYACGPCNGPKSNRHGIVVKDTVEEFKRGRAEVIVPPPDGPVALINPRMEDPLEFLELDIGGVTPDGVQIDGTFDFLSVDSLSRADGARAIFTIEVLGLNREVMRVARANAFRGFRARLREYVVEKEHECSATRLMQLKEDLLRTPHLTVFAEMRRQRLVWPEIDHLFQRAPEAESWSLVLQS